MQACQLVSRGVKYVDVALGALLTSESRDYGRGRKHLGLRVLEPEVKAASFTKFNIKFGFQCAECSNL
ncbi:hypothetical protein C1H46_009790 [Malus baccata]|uniref:Uncharacterized protein n=1 Tax=Malus baccata TaxID=106549 RepID=A0A540N0L4_MALBA|nr:hypothetical protein C1H46_009790 [Malus baccata]